MTPESPALEIEGVTVLFGDRPGLRDLSFALPAGERLALVGPSGAGKTSLLRVIAGSGRAAGGRIRVLGREVQALAPERRGVILLSQSPLLFPHLSVFENVAFPLRVRRVAGAEVRERVRASLEAVRLDGFDARRPASLSGGQARRVALARAMAARPPVLLLDEPLAGLDPALREELRGSIRAVHEDYRPALVLVTHDLAEAGEMADRIGLLLGGGLAQEGDPGALFRYPASLEVARFLGLGNEVPWSLLREGVEEGRPGSSRPQDADAVAVFGPHAARLAPVAAAHGIAVVVRGITHRPDGAVARVAGPCGTEIEVAVDPHDPPRPGDRARLLVDGRRVHLFPPARDPRAS